MNKTIEELIAYWQFRKGFNANIADLAKYMGVSRPTVYTWLNRKVIPKEQQLKLIQEWLNKKV